MSKKDKVSLKINDLQPGDVLLSFGHGWLSDAIRYLDGGRYSHAGFFDGVKIVEAAKAGIVYHDIPEDLKLQKYIHVYRYKGDKGDHLGSAEFPVKPLIDVATRYRDSGEKFAYQQLFLMALLAISRKAPIPLFLKKLLRTVLDEAMGALNDVLQDNKQPVTCSELVYRIYDEAGPIQQYALTIEGVIEMDKFKGLAKVSRAPVSMAAADDEDAAEFERLSQQFAQRYFQAKSLAAAKRPNPLVVADFVSPRDLETSENLEEIGPLSIS
jgi:hypothetical protein